MSGVERSWSGFFAAQRLKLQASKSVRPVLFDVMSSYDLWKEEMFWKKSKIGLFSWRLDHFLQKMHSQSNEWIKQNENKHFHNFLIDWVKHCTITAFFVQDLAANPGVIGCTSRKVPSPSLKSLSPEPRLPPQPYLFPLSCFWTVVMLVIWGHGCSPWLNILISMGFLLYSGPMQSK